MAQLVLPYPDFQPNTKIVSAQVDANNAAIVNLLNGGLGPDNVLFPFLATGTLGVDKSGTATAIAGGKNSQDIVLRGSGWDGAAAQDRDWILRNVVTSAAAYGLLLKRKDGAGEADVLSIYQGGTVFLYGDATQDAILKLQGVAGKGGAVQFYPDATLRSQLKALTGGGILWDIRGGAGGTISWLSVNGDTGDATLAKNLTVNGAGPHPFAGRINSTVASGSMQMLLARTGTAAGSMGIGADVNGFAVWDSAGATRLFTVSPAGDATVTGNLAVSGTGAHTFAGPVKVGSAAADPAGSNGLIYYDSANNRLRAYVGGVWKTITVA